jgi:hypothetical protein
MIVGRWSCAVIAALALACSSNDKGAGVADAKLPKGARAEGLDHEECSESGNRVEVLDTNGDGKQDIRRVFDKRTGHELCRVVDLNHDVKPDLYEYFDDTGTIRRRELCFDDTGVVNAIEYYEGGKLARREYDTTGQHKIDTWDWFDPTTPIDPKTQRPLHPSRRERDTTGDGRIDQWWTWDGDKVTIAFDRNGDGKPDPAATIVLNDMDAGAPPPAAGDAGAADAGLEAAPAAVEAEAGATDGGGDGGKR